MARRLNKSILMEINPEYSLEGLMLKLKLQCFGHLMWKADSLEKTLILGKIEGRKRRGRQRMRWLDGIMTQWTWVWANSRRNGEGQGSLACHSACGHKESDMTEWLNNDNNCLVDIPPLPWLLPNHCKFFMVTTGVGNGNPLQYSHVENSTNRGAWQAIVHGVAESDTTERLSMHTHMHNHIYHLFPQRASSPLCYLIGPRGSVITLATQVWSWDPLWIVLFASLLTSG